MHRQAHIAVPVKDSWYKVKRSGCTCRLRVSAALVGGTGTQPSDTSLKVRFAVYDDVPVRFKLQLKAAAAARLGLDGNRSTTSPNRYGVAQAVQRNIDRQQALRSHVRVRSVC